METSAIENASRSDVLKFSNLLKNYREIFFIIFYTNGSESRELSLYPKMFYFCFERVGLIVCLVCILPILVRAVNRFDLFYPTVYFGGYLLGCSVMKLPILKAELKVNFFFYFQKKK